MCGMRELHAYIPRRIVGCLTSPRQPHVKKEKKEKKNVEVLIAIGAHPKLKKPNL